MKNKILRFAIVTAVCLLIYLFATFVSFTPNLKVVDFVKGFVLGIGSVSGITLVVLLIRRAANKPETAQ
jgi:hypothetical protein